MERQVLLTGAYQYTEEQLHMIEKMGWKVTFVKNELEPIGIPTDQFDAVICNGLFLYNDIAEFKKLKMVQATSAGMDRLPIEYMEKHHIMYYNAKGVYSIPMAEWAVMSVLEICKNAHGFFRKQQEHIWGKDRSLLELTGKKVCIIGYGDVGHETAKRLAAFGTEITAMNRSRVEEDGVISRWLSLDRLDEALPEADIVILCIALTEETRGLLNADRLRLMKQGSLLVNVARGALIDEKALIRCLKEEKLRGAALDVFETEPLPEESELWEMPGVIISPHNSFVGDQIRERMFDLICENLKRI
ncbi:NAD(P)-dependent oxidoreductase [Mediterraneibacter glycyrrhizinilyticus]|uniref:NAD(P)-dependent oxidoreductase n=1 Tax=Mediterraneibacter glycyrrhizinilyticus TaxID=342942 RepID=UPI0025AA67A2|nr:NAD(P)-dependent oxidoreductase [Mediterraneibacter glycyrrhizinilyticus]MDN0061374.1 NAD(P)-dependent oxidoreductase [Mediterraneibacter glycyrrhizinilyticus]